LIGPGLGFNPDQRRGVAVVNVVVHDDEADLAVRAKRGDKAAFAAIYHCYRAPVYGYLRARLLDSHDAEDLASEVFLRLFDAIRRFDEDRRLQSWLMGICRNVLREHIRHVHRRKEVGWTELCLELEGMVESEGLYDDVLHLVPLCMANLNEASTNALHWHYMGGMKVEKIAERLNRTLGAVKVMMVRARQSLKRCIKSRLQNKAP
jgi:RNA polymerase sigma-70 factor, ECF subfamily